MDLSFGFFFGFRGLAVHGCLLGYASYTEISRRACSCWFSEASFECNATAAVAPEAVEAPRSAEPVFQEEQMLL